MTEIQTHLKEEKFGQVFFVRSWFAQHLNECPSAGSSNSLVRRRHVSPGRLESMRSDRVRTR